MNNRSLTAFLISIPTMPIFAQTTIEDARPFAPTPNNPNEPAIYTILQGLTETPFGAFMSAVILAVGFGIIVYTILLAAGVPRRNSIGMGILTGVFIFGSYVAMALGGVAVASIAGIVTIAAVVFAAIAIPVYLGVRAFFAAINFTAFLVSIGVPATSAPAITTSINGAIAGAAAGAAAGAIVGSAIPGVGTAVGAVVGAIVGGILGWFA